MARPHGTTNSSTSTRRLPQRVWAGGVNEAEEVWFWTWPHGCRRQRSSAHWAAEWASINSSYSEMGSQTLRGLLSPSNEDVVNHVYVHHQIREGEELLACGYFQSDWRIIAPATNCGGSWQFYNALLHYKTSSQTCLEQLANRGWTKALVRWDLINNKDSSMYRVEWRAGYCQHSGSRFEVHKITDDSPDCTNLYCLLELCAAVDLTYVTRLYPHKIYEIETVPAIVRKTN